jgi:indole-3-glycerol phosphate synthase / phosphoribosylanthranilate isomerase
VNIRDTIVAARRARIARDGHEMGCTVPASRTVPLVPFGVPPFLVCEVKRRSPSRGALAADRDAVSQARLYAERGVKSLSVLTEQDHFSGSLDDLVRIKKELPGLAVLRKDFLVDREDIEVSWRAGADAVLLIAAALDAKTLADLHARAAARGMAVLVEIHDEADARACRSFAPPLVGVNCRDLATFAVDLLHPLQARAWIDWPARCIFESGVRTPQDVGLARSGGYEGVLVGETAVRAPGTIPSLLGAFTVPASSFWPRVAVRRRHGRPLVKICGIAREEDAGVATALGADLLGFVFAPSPRRASAAVVRAVRRLDIPKVAVVVTPAAAGGPAGRTHDAAPLIALPPEVEELLSEGALDAVQLHGEETPDQCAVFPWPFYKAIRVRAAADAAAIAGFPCPRVLADAFAPGAAGGTGQRVPAELAQEAARAGPLWLAGGIGPDNVAEVIRSLAPELIDASSRLEESPGRKDHALLERYFQEINRHEKV